MKIVIAPDKFKGSLSAADVCSAIAAGLRQVDPGIELDLCPMADGGEGTVDALVAATGGRFETRRVTGPLAEMRVEARLGILGDGATAVIEMAQASGLHYLPADQRDPMRTTTFGTGQLLMEAAKLGVKKILLGIGGSATIDAGLGCAQACQLPIILRPGSEPLADTEPLAGRDIDSVVLVKHGRGSPIDGVAIDVACDVINPLFGPNGAAPVFGPQKGATPEQVRQLDDSLRQLAERLGKLDVASTPGAGAAGGLGFGMMAYFGATLRSGIQIVIDATGLRQRLAGADLCITGEGRLDEQSASGKTAVGVAQLCHELAVPCIALAGSIGEGAETALAHGLSAYFSISDGPRTLDSALAETPRLLSATAANVLRLIKRRG